MLETINRKLERWLIGRGFRHPDTRIVVRNQIYVSLGTSLVIVLVTLLSRWSFAFTAGALLALFNFWTLARILRNVADGQKKSPFVLFLIFMVKMTLSGLALYWLIGVERVPHWGLISGIGTVPINLTVTGLMQAGNNKA
ncbi:ATP synthase subunit I [Pseudodesulfovibrio sp. zrk46]|uniref:ATP synthase subunit I n=1 Tax=Pseudodesulfovibrio sp. zrk46 TaxID=2725288 RepID=UPI001FFD2A7F|nr:ATP synthase subunit I [Pseudodesulfovibrio sp. zrk46]